MKFKTTSSGLRHITHADWAEDVLEIEVTDGRVFVGTTNGHSVSIGLKRFNKIVAAVNKEAEKQMAALND